MNKVFVVIVILTAVIVSCKTSQKAVDISVPVDDTIRDTRFRKPIRDKELYAATTELVPLDTVFISKDTLHVFTKRILGCDEENFKLMWNGAMMKSLPPQTSVKLFQRVDADCKERHRFHLTYNITPLRFKLDSTSALQDSVRSRIMIVRIGGYKNSLKYGF